MRDVERLWQIDPELGESLQPREREIAHRMSALIARGVCRQFAAHGAPARRDVHAAAHGCVRAEFKVEASLSDELAQGVFVRGVTYGAWIRFSNGSADVKRSDAKGDVRAMAIKLLGVRTCRTSPDEQPVASQDFILLNCPVFMAHDVAGYLAFIKRQASWNPITRGLAAFALGWKGALIARRLASSRIGNPLAVRYWSTVPFQLGDTPQKEAVKFSVVPHAAPVPVPRRAGARYLRQAMIDYLSTRDATFDFLVQPRTSPAMSVEDSRVEWKEIDAPFYKVATITIPKQEFATAERDTLAENLAFNPWHTLPEHRPLGGVNRTRRVVYEAIADLRRQFNEVSRGEPVDVDRS